MKLNDLSASLAAGNVLSRTTDAISKSLQRLSSGLRVNSPADDPGAYSMGVTLDAQVRGYQQAVLNANIGIGVASTAEDAFQSQLEILQKMRELAVQASNGIYSVQDRANLNSEFQSLLGEFQNITANTQFNGTRLLDGSFGSKTLQIGASGNAFDRATLQIDSTQTNTAFQKTIGTGTFQPASTFAGESWDSQNVLSDINGDGKLDMVDVDPNENVVSVYLGLGNGKFASRTTYTVGATNTRGIALGDINGDGKADVLTADQTDGTISILLGNGDGTFKSRTTIAASNPSKLAVADFNHDGKLDIASLNVLGSAVQIMLGNGDGSFQAIQTFTTGVEPDGIGIGDLNGDGNSDLVISNFTDGTVSTLLGNGDGTFKAQVTKTVGTWPGQVSLADINRDGKLDAVIANAGSGNLSVLLGVGDGTFQNPTTITEGSVAQTLSDLTGDGVADLVDIDNGGNIFLSAGNGDGTFKAAVTVGAASAYAVAVGDINKDGVNDIVTGSTGVSNTVLLGATQNVSAASNLNLSTQSNAQYLINILNNTINYLTKEQSNVEAIHSRLEENVANNLLAADTLDQAKQNALNVDVATETADFAANQILQNGATAVLAQANVDQEMVFQLLQGLGKGN